MSTTESVKILPSPPFIPIPHLPNFRTIGQHKLQDGCSYTRGNYVYRCAAPTGVSPETLRVLSDLKIKTFYDLRSAREIERLKSRSPITEFEGSERVFVPVFADTDASPLALGTRLAAYAETGPQGFVRAYDEILEHGVGAYRTIFTHIRDRSDEPLVIHCTAGKDRTGVVVMLILNLAGVPNEVISEEYELTQAGLRHEMEVWVPLLLKEPAYNGDEDAVRRSLSARKDSMMGTLELLESKYGGAEGYLVKHLGFSKEDTEKIRRNLIE